MDALTHSALILQSMSALAQTRQRPLSHLLHRVRVDLPQALQRLTMKSLVWAMRDIHVLPAVVLQLREVVVSLERVARSSLAPLDTFSAEKYPSCRCMALEMLLQTANFRRVTASSSAISVRPSVDASILLRRRSMPPSGSISSSARERQNVLVSDAPANELHDVLKLLVTAISPGSLMVMRASDFTRCD